MTIIGIDIGGSKCAVVKATDDGAIQQKIRFATRGPAETQTQIWDAIASLDVRDPVFGVSCGGPLDSQRGLIMSPPNLPGWDAVPICDLLETRFGGRAFLMNDANSGALAEWRFGAGQGCQNIVFLTYGTGMGAGIICDGRLYNGSNGNAGEVGHVRLSQDGPRGYGKMGSFEGWCSGGGIARLAQAEAEKRHGKVAFNPGRMEDITARTVAEAAHNNDSLAIDILDRSGERLGQALAIIIDILNPERVILGSVFHRARRWLEPSMRSSLESEALAGSLAVCQVLPTALGEHIGDYAAIAIAVYHAGGFDRAVRSAVDHELLPLHGAKA